MQIFPERAVRNLGGPKCHEPVTTVVGVIMAAKALYDMANPPKAPKYGSTLTVGEATKQAGAQLNPLYDQRMKDVQKNVQGDLINRGFNGQQAGTELAASTAANIENQRILAVNGLAQSLMRGSADDSYRKAALDYQYDIRNRQLTSKALDSSMNWLDNANWQLSLNNLGGKQNQNLQTWDQKLAG